MKKTLLLLLIAACILPMSAKEDYPKGAAKGKFSVSDTQQVYISMGNLYYKKYNWVGDFYFQEADTAFVGLAHEWGTSANDDKMIDLFGWGTSGTDKYEPYLNSTNSADYFSQSHSLYESWKISENSDYMENGYDYDWGSKRIANGGNREGQWRTLTQGEWEYLLSRRTTDDLPLAARACIRYGSVIREGYLVLPDNFRQPEGVSTLLDDGNVYNANNYSLPDYEKLVAAGAIFLPAAGYREGTTISLTDEDDHTAVGYYWTADNAFTQAVCIVFTEKGLWTDGSYDRYTGASVRLVQDVPNQDIPSAIPNLHQSPSARKIIRNGEVLILRDGKTYNLLGIEQD